MKRVFQYLQVLICIVFIFNLIHVVYAWIPNGVFSDPGHWGMGQIAMMSVEYLFAFGLVTMIKKYFNYKAEM